MNRAIHAPDRPASGAFFEGPPRDARTEYLRLLRARGASAAGFARREAAVAFARLAVFGAIVLLAWLGFISRRIPPFWTLLPFAAFLFLVVAHDRLIRSRRKAERAVSYFQRGLARLDDAWAGTGESGEGFIDPTHPYAEDLDIFGRGSLFELICTCRTQIGQRTLAGWLRSPAPPENLRDRQTAVAELVERIDLREDLAVLGEEVRERVDPARLIAWASNPSRGMPGHAAPASVALGLLAIAALLGWIAVGTGPLPLVCVLMLQAVVLHRWRRPIGLLVQGVERPVGELSLLAHSLRRLEKERFESPRLRHLLATLRTGGVPPSRRIAGLARLIDRLEWARNMMFAPVAYLCMWTPLHACAIDAWRMRHGPEIGRWLETLGEMDALCAFSGYAFERPADTAPEILEAPSLLDAEGLGHPLLPEGRCVRNDVRLDDRTSLLIVSGSNMSGKSTLLRAIGTNAVLAFAGAPVRARRMRISPLAVGASISRQDSLLEGTSRFYAEITRLRQLVDIAGGPAPLLFLVDEVLNGTNSHDRRIGAEAVMRGLVARGAVGLITTHDLALAAIADTLAGRAANIHFEDQIVDGRIAFDYRIHPGVVTKSNALALMRAVGLDVGPESEHGRDRE